MYNVQFTMYNFGTLRVDFTAIAWRGTYSFK